MAASDLADIVSWGGDTDMVMASVSAVTAAVMAGHSSEDAKGAVTAVTSAMKAGRTVEQAKAEAAAIVELISTGVDEQTAVRRVEKKLQKEHRERKLAESRSEPVIRRTKSPTSGTAPNLSASKPRARLLDAGARGQGEKPPDKDPLPQFPANVVTLGYGSGQRRQPERSAFGGSRLACMDPDGGGRLKLPSLAKSGSKPECGRSPTGSPGRLSPGRGRKGPSPTRSRVGPDGAVSRQLPRPPGLPTHASPRTLSTSLHPYAPRWPRPPPSLERGSPALEAARDREAAERDGSRHNPRAAPPGDGRCRVAP